MKAAVILALLGTMSLGASAQSLGDHTTCYSWNGGNHSSGSFIQCDTWAAPAKRVVVAPLPPPVQPSPIMMPVSAPVTCAPPPKPVLRHHKPKPKRVCK